uniref:Uncharacterized protein n=1 Tax=viral metagenome TaxID=1070528 RepID=A0A6M3K7J4_9ZZZZ
MKIEETIKKYLGEGSEETVPETVKGVTKWLNDFEEIWNFGNVKLAKGLLNDIIKALNKMNKRLK